MVTYHNIKLFQHSDVSCNTLFKVRIFVKQFSWSIKKRSCQQYKYFGSYKRKRASVESGGRQSRLECTDQSSSIAQVQYCTVACNNHTLPTFPQHSQEADFTMLPPFPKVESWKSFSIVRWLLFLSSSFSFGLVLQFNFSENEQSDWCGEAITKSELESTSTSCKVHVSPRDPSTRYANYVACICLCVHFLCHSLVY